MNIRILICQAPKAHCCPRSRPRDLFSRCASLLGPLGTRHAANRRGLGETVVAKGLLTLGCGCVVGGKQAEIERAISHWGISVHRVPRTTACRYAGRPFRRANALHASLQLAGHVKTSVSSHPLHRGGTRSDRIFVDGAAPVHLRGVYGVPRPHQLRHCFRHK